MSKQTINDRDYFFGTIPPREALRVEVSIGRVVGEPLFKAMMDHKKVGGSEEEMKAAGAVAIGQVLANMDADELEKTMDIVFKYVTVEKEQGQAPKKINIDMDFVGRNKDLWLVFVAALRHNFSDFLPESLFGSLRGALRTE